MNIKYCLKNRKLPEKWFWGDIVIISIRTLWFSIGLAYAILGYAPIRPLWVNIIFIIAGYGVPLIFFTPDSKHSAAIATSELLINGTHFIYTVFLIKGMDNFFLISVLFIAYCSNKKVLLYSSPLILLLPLVGLLFNISFFDGIFTLIIYSFIFLVLGYVINRLVYFQRVIQDKNKILEQYSKQIEKFTIIEERNRIAKDIHDSLGHSLVSVIMGMDAVIYLAKASSPDITERLKKLRELTKTSLDTIRSSVHNISDLENYALLLPSIKHMLDEFEQYTNTKVVFNVSGAEYKVSHHANITLLRCLQESLTNAKKHGECDVVSVLLSYGTDYIMLSINDNGIGKEAISYDFGLIAMEERLALLGGSLEIVSNPSNGTSVKCKIPANRLNERG